MIDSIGKAIHISVSVPPEAIRVALPRTPFLESQLAAALAGVVVGYVLSTANAIVSHLRSSREREQWTRRLLTNDILIDLPLAQRELLRLRESLDPGKPGGSEAARGINRRIVEAHSAVRGLERFETELQGINDHTLDGLADFARRALLLLDEASNATLVDPDVAGREHPSARANYRMKFVELETEIDKYVRRGAQWAKGKQPKNARGKELPNG
jgi:hypothetical protein